jgi:hypothetical protein
MRTSLSGVLTLTALAAAVVVASTIPTASQVARPLSALAAGDNDDGLVTEVRRGGGGGFRGGGGGARFAGNHRRGGMRVAQGGVHHGNRHANWHRGTHWNGGNYSNGWGWGAAGLALGAGVGYRYGAYGYPYGSGYSYGYEYPAYGYDCVRLGGCARD